MLAAALVAAAAARRHPCSLETHCLPRRHLAFVGPNVGLLVCCLPSNNLQPYELSLEPVSSRLHDLGLRAFIGQGLVPPCHRRQYSGEVALHLPLFISSYRSFVSLSLPLLSLNSSSSTKPQTGALLSSAGTALSLCLHLSPFCVSPFSMPAAAKQEVKAGGPRGGPQKK